MRNKINKKHIDYLILLFAAMAAVTISLIYSINKQVVTLTVISFAAFYVIWGLIHHKEEGTLYFEVILEYVLFAVLGSFLILGLL